MSLTVLEREQGGRPRSSLYFIGNQEDKVFYLDPHTVQKAVGLTEDLRADVRSVVRSLELTRVLAVLQSSSYHCSHVASMPATNLDPSLAIGFYCRNKDDFENFCERAKQVRVAICDRPLTCGCLPACPNEASRVLRR